MSELPAQPFDVLQATWPAADTVRIGSWEINAGAGGGKRVSAARPIGANSIHEISVAEREMEELNQTSLFQLRAEHSELDAALEEREYLVSDPTVLLACSIRSLIANDVPPVTAFSIWPPLQIMRDLWNHAGTGPERLAVMDRVKGAKTSLLGRINDRAAGVGFVAVSDGTAMVHALEVVEESRRQGLATNMMIAAAHWASDQGANSILLAVTRANSSGLALYHSLGMEEVGSYHYRIAPTR